MNHGSGDHDSNTRIVRLVSILGDEAAARTSAADAADIHLRSVATERLRKLTTELRDASGASDVDTLTARVLLNEYRVAVMHLRIVAQMAANRVESATRPVKLAHRVMQQIAKDVTDL